MSDTPDKESQTEEATEKRLHDSIEKGDTPHSREVTLFASLLASLLFSSFFLRAGANRLVGALQHMLDQSALFDLGAGRNASALIAAALEAAADFLLPAFVLFVAAALIAAFSQNPPRLVGGAHRAEMGARVAARRLVAPRQPAQRHGIRQESWQSCAPPALSPFSFSKAKSARPTPRSIRTRPASPTTFSPPPRAFSPASPPPSSPSPPPIFCGRGCIGGATCA